MPFGLVAARNPQSDPGAATDQGAGIGHVGDICQRGVRSHRPRFGNALALSLTCWSAGMMGVRWTTVLIASLLFRISRFLIYYVLIVSTERLIG